MWKLLCGVMFLAAFIYYATVILQMAGIVKIGEKIGFSWSYLIPFYMWFEK